MSNQEPTKTITANFDMNITKEDFSCLLLRIVRLWWGDMAYSIDGIKKSISIYRMSPVPRHTVTAIFYRDAADGTIQIYRAEELYFHGSENTVRPDFDFSEGRLKQEVFEWIETSVDIGRSICP